MSITPNVMTVPSPEQTVSRRVVVAADRAELFELVASPWRHPELDGSGSVRQTVSGPARLGPGDRFTIAMRLGPIRYRMTSQVTEVEENSRLEWRHPVGHRWRWEFAEVTSGLTAVTETWDYRGSRGRRLLEMVGYPERNADGISRTLERLRSRYAVDHG